MGRRETDMKLTEETGYCRKCRLRRERYRVLRKLGVHSDDARQRSQNGLGFVAELSRRGLDASTLYPELVVAHPRLPKLELKAYDSARRDRYHRLRQAGLNAADATTAATGAARTEAALAALGCES